MPDNLILMITIILPKWILLPPSIFFDPESQLSMQLFPLSEFFLRAVQFKEIEEVFRGLGTRD